MKSILSLAAADNGSNGGPKTGLLSRVRRGNKPSIAEFGPVKKSLTYRSWRGMIERCKAGDKDRAKYYDRGITVCERWFDFENFLADMGERPVGRYSLDRIDNERGYEPGNCRWATDKQQNGNRRSVPREMVFGELLTIQEAGEKHNIPWHTLRYHRAQGRSLEKAIKRVKFGFSEQNVYLEHEGEAITQSEYAARIGTPLSTVRDWIRKGTLLTVTPRALVKVITLTVAMAALGGLSVAHATTPDSVCGNGNHTGNPHCSSGGTTGGQGGTGGAGGAGGAGGTGIGIGGNQHQGQGQFQGQSQGQSQSSHNRNDNTNVNANSNTSRNRNSNQNANTSLSGGGASSSGGNSYNSNSSYSEPVQAPSIAAPAVIGGNACAIGASAGVSLPGFGVMGGAMWESKNCELRQRAALLYNMGYQQAAKELMCSVKETYDAFKTAGIPCAARTDFEPKTASAAPVPAPAVTAAAPAPKSYVRCSATVTDNCVE